MKIELNQNYIPSYVRFVIKKLKKRGHSAFLVGGSVRDLILDIKPRDFDVATDANPYKVKSIFKNSYLIGKRFKLVQTNFGKEKVEISTFRKDPGIPPENLRHREKLIWVNKFFGTLEEDAKRRDFTINSLYYDPLNFELIDFTNGYEDLKNKIIKTIGDPYDRFLEDPVRIIRACALSCRLNFKMDPGLEKAIDLLKNEILLLPKPRIQEEILRILKSHFSYQTFKLLEDKNILKSIFPFKYEYSEKFKDTLKIIDEIHTQFSDEEIFLFLFFSMFFEKIMEWKDFENIDKESFLYRKNFIKELDQYKAILKSIFFSKKINNKFIKNKKFSKILKMGIKLSKIYPKFKKNVLNWKTFYFINRIKHEEVK